ncbi:Cardiotrophin-2 [Varanus komodoensis]|uniref:cardiotrophin-2-like n=1 Tax=Varanus komodoensis TaxID=61221 RepID=UPI001CF7B7D8|nr:cardiotrophin-2-like [Varanus komodoensis]KAF7235578.1 Cardiotrophin-2 [Varanus komodoensis]
MSPSAVRSLWVLCAALVQAASPNPDCFINTKIAQTFNLVHLLKANTTVLLNTYLSHQGSPFSDPGFSSSKVQYKGVPTASIPFLKWRTLSDTERLDKNYEAYTILSEFLQLVWDDQFHISDGKDELLEMLRVTRLRIQGLLSNLTSIMTALGVPPTPVADLLTPEVIEATTFEKKIRGYVVCDSYRQWVERTVRDFSLLMEKFPT